MRTRTARDWRDLAAILAPAGLIPADAFPALSARQGEAEWLPLYRLASAHLVSPTLYAVLAQRGQLEEVPLIVREALGALYELNDQRNGGLRTVLQDTVRVLNAVGIEPLLLKGAIALLPDPYPHAGARVLGDLDVAVHPAQIAPAVAALEAAGYFPAPNIYAAARSLHDHHHWFPLYHPSGDGYVELHHDLFHAPRLKRVLSLSLVRARAEAFDWDGLRVHIPALEHRLLHNALHHQVQDRGFPSDRRSLRQLLEFAHLRALPTAVALDWPELFVQLDKVGVGDAVRAWFLAAQGLFGQPLPTGVQPTPAALRAEARFWTRLDQPWLDRLLEWHWQSRRIGGRLVNLPRRLLTPAWYPAKWFYLRKRWLVGRVDDGRD